MNTKTKSLHLFLIEQNKDVNFESINRILAQNYIYVLIRFLYKCKL